MSEHPRRLFLPWTVIEHDKCFEVRNAAGVRLCCCCFDNDPQRRFTTNRLTREEARKLAKAFARLPELLDKLV